MNTPMQNSGPLLNGSFSGPEAFAQLVRDARDHGVEVRPISVNHSLWDCTLEPRADAGFEIAQLGGIEHVERDAALTHQTALPFAFRECCLLAVDVQVAGVPDQLARTETDFAALAAAQPRFGEYLDHHMPFYDRLLQHAD